MYVCNVCMYIHIYIYIHMYVCVYIYIYIYIHIYLRYMFGVCCTLVLGPPVEVLAVWRLLRGTMSAVHNLACAAYNPSILFGLCYVVRVGGLQRTHSASRLHLLFVSMLP